MRTLLAGIDLGILAHHIYKRERARRVLARVHAQLREDEERRRWFGIRYVPGGNA